MKKIITILAVGVLSVSSCFAASAKRKPAAVLYDKQVVLTFKEKPVPRDAAHSNFVYNTKALPGSNIDYDHFVLKMNAECDFISIASTAESPPLG